MSLLTLSFVVVVLAALLAGLFIWRQRQAAAALAAQRRHADALDTVASWEPQATRVLRPVEHLAMLTVARGMPDYMVLAQVPLSRFIRVPQRNSYSEWLRRVGQLSPDLIVCDRSSRVIAAIEVERADGKATARANRRVERMRRVISAAGIPFHVWTEGQLPTSELARQIILPKELADVAAKPEPAAAAAKALSLSDFDNVVDQPMTRRPPELVDAVEDVVAIQGAPSSWFEEDFDPDSEFPEPQPLKRQGSRR